MKISTYVNNNYVKMSSEEIWKLFENREVNKEIISRTQLPMILKMAFSFARTTGNDIEELFSTALLTLMESIDDYDLSKNRPFVSYYKVRVNNALINYNDNTIRIP